MRWRSLRRRWEDIRKVDVSPPIVVSCERLVEEQVGPVMHPPMTDRFAAGDYIALAAKTRPDGWQKWSAAQPEAPKPRSTRFLDHHWRRPQPAAWVSLCAQRSWPSMTSAKAASSRHSAFSPMAHITASSVRRWRRRRLGSNNLCLGFARPFKKISMRRLESHTVAVPNLT